MLSKSVSLAFLASILLSASAAYAEDSDLPNEVNARQSPLEELVVSEFRQTLPVDVNTSLTQLNQTEIEDYSLQHFEELVQLVPNMNFSGEGSRARYFQLRGIGELEQYEGAPNPSVGFIIDDIDLSGVGGIASTFDMQQVEVLRGPQGTRFGANALAGLVYARSAEPTTELSVNTELMFGSDDQFGFGAAVGGPLSENVQGRISAHTYQSNGFRDNLYLGRDDTNGRDELSLRGKLNWQIGNDWEAKFSGLYADYDNGYDAFVIDNGPDTFSDKPGDDSQETLAGSLKLAGPIGSAVNFVSITSYASSDIVFSFDADWGNNDGYWDPYVYDFFARNDRERDVLTQEFRFLSSEDGRIFNDTTDWLLGVYGQSLDEKNDENLSGFYDDGGFCTAGACDARTNLKSSYDSSNLALFGKLDSALTERWSLAVGLRLERWAADYSDTKTDLLFAPNAPVSSTFSPSENMWGGDIALSYQVTDDSNLYGLISRGYKAGGFNPSVSRINFQPGDQFGVEDTVYDPEYLINYELGYKGLWQDGRVTADISVFYMDRNDMQLRSSVQNTPGDPFSFTFITSNGAGYSYGLETSAAWQFAENWQVFGSMGLLQSKVEAYKFAQDEDVIGREFANAPPYTFNLGTSYRDSEGWFGRVDVVGKGAFYYDYSHNRKSEAYQTVNLKLGKEWERLAVYAWGRNIFDEEYFTRGFFFGNEPPAFDNKLYTKYGDPRTYGVTAKYSF